MGTDNTVHRHIATSMHLFGQVNAVAVCAALKVHKRALEHRQTNKVSSQAIGLLAPKALSNIYVTKRVIGAATGGIAQPLLTIRPGSGSQILACKP